MKRVLSIDGGGVRGVLPASFLARLEEVLEVQTARYFDLIVGTSTGGIIALGLAAGLPASEILGFYEKRGPEIFGGPRLLRRARQFAASKYGNDKLRAALRDVFGDRRLGESLTRVVVPAVNVDTGEVHIYKTAHHPKFRIDYPTPVVDVALATSAAPTYFPAFTSAGGTALLDGGLYANNPVGLAAVEAVTILGWARTEIDILSLGCGSEPPRRSTRRRRLGGYAGWAPQLAAVTLRAQSSLATGTAELLVGHDNVCRVDPPVPEGRYGLDLVDEIPGLRGLGETEARKRVGTLETRFFEGEVAVFEPYRSI